LDQVAPDGNEESTNEPRARKADRSKDEPGDDLDVPEFIPRG